MKSIIISLFLIFLAASKAYAACQWTYLNALNKDIKHSNQLLSDYAVCRNSCNTLEGSLNNSIAKMANDSGCGADIVTRKNRDMIDFIASRFKLIKKQKSGKTWTETASAKPALDSVKQAVVPVKRVVSALVKKPLLRRVKRKQLGKKTVAPLIAQSPEVEKQTKMMLSREVYEKQKRLTLQRKIQQRQTQQRKQALLHQKKVQQVKASGATSFKSAASSKAAVIKKTGDGKAFESAEGSAAEAGSGTKSP